MSGPTILRASVDRHVVLADVHAVGAHRRGDVGAVVEDEQRAVRIARIRGDACRFGEELVLECFSRNCTTSTPPAIASARNSLRSRSPGMQSHTRYRRAATRRARRCSPWDRARAAGGPSHASLTACARSPAHRLSSPRTRGVHLLARLPPRGVEGCGRAPSSINGMGATTESTVDLAVLGGGIVGLSVAWRARARGMSVAVLERERLGGGATHVAAGMLAPVAEVEFGEAGRRVLELGVRSAEHVARLRRGARARLRHRGGAATHRHAGRGARRGRGARA